MDVIMTKSADMKRYGAGGCRRAAVPLRAHGVRVLLAVVASRHVYTVRADIQPGNSGSPLLAPAGAVYGMVFAALTGTSSAGYALAGGEVSAAVRAAASRTAAVSTQPLHLPG
jgi:S1-C subfamily serine protease